MRQQHIRDLEPVNADKPESDDIAVGCAVQTDTRGVIKVTLIRLPRPRLPRRFASAWPGFLLAALLLVAMQPATAQSRQDYIQLNQRINQLEEQLYNMRARLETARNSFAASGNSENPGSVAELSVRMNAIEEQLRNMTGQVERFGFEINQLKQQVGGSQSSGAAPSSSGQSGQYANNGASGYGDSSGRDLNESGLSGSSGVLGQLPANGLGQGYGDTTQGGPVQLSRVTEAEQLYERSYGDMLQRRFDAAESGFKGFLRQYPGHELAGNAQYWLGETYYARGRYREAASAFISGYRDHAQSRKAPDSLLKLAITLNQLNQKQESCATLSQLKSQYPNASEAVKNRAGKERQRLRC